ncbi:MAG: hypothetical protein Q8R72_14980 [Hylemonella sp.]|nr:hypothetical protein [Hylemonella sp.]
MLFSDDIESIKQLWEIHAEITLRESLSLWIHTKKEHMNKLANQFISSMQGLLGRPLAEDAHAAVRIEDIRQAMIDCLGDEGCQSYPHIERRVLFAPDLQGLWYLRADIMVVISSLQGEGVANQKIRIITGMFEGLLPRSMISRPGALSR